MIFKSLKIKNYGCYSDDKFTEIKFSKDINPIVGKNNVGKSTIFNVLQYIVDGQFNPNENFKGKPNVFPEIELISSLSRSEIHQIVNPFLINVGDKDEILNYQIESFPDVIYFRINNGLYSKIGNVWAHGANIVHHDWRPGSAIDSRGLLTPGLLRSLKQIKFDTFFNNQFNRVDNKYIAGSGIALSFDIQSILVSFLKNNLKIFPEFRTRPGGGDQEVLESLSGIHVASVLNTLKNGDSNQIRKWRRIKSSFESFYPSLILDVRKPPSREPKVWIEKKSIDYDVPVEKVGAGISEFIVFITHLIDSEEKIFALDCSEIHFHPHAQRKFFKLIEEYSKKNQFLMITHSPNFFNSNYISNLILVKNEEGTATINQYPSNYFNAEEKNKLTQLLMPQLKELFFSDFVLMVEGPTESGAFPVFASSLGRDFDDNNVSIIETGKYFDIPIKLCEGLQIKFLAVCDRDALMNIENHFYLEGVKVECSPVIKTLFNFNILYKDDFDLITNENNFRVVDTKKGKIKYYQNDIFDKLKEIALRKNIFTLTSKFETIIKRSGYGNYIDEIRNQGIRSKPIIGQYVASKIVKNKEPIPKQFNTVLNYVNK